MGLALLASPWKEMLCHFTAMLAACEHKPLRSPIKKTFRVISRQRGAVVDLPPRARLLNALLVEVPYPPALGTRVVICKRGLDSGIEADLWMPKGTPRDRWQDDAWQAVLEESEVEK